MLREARPTETIGAEELETQKLINSKLGLITRTTRLGLEKRSCECYKVIPDDLADRDTFDTRSTP